MKIYISASKREQAAALASLLKKKHEIVSSWINESTGLFTDEELKRTFEDIDKCDVYISS